MNTIVVHRNMIYAYRMHVTNSLHHNQIDVGITLISRPISYN